MLIDLPDETMQHATDQATAAGISVTAWIRLAIHDNSVRLPDDGLDEAFGFWTGPPVPACQPAI
jgi:hypothetical protein